MLSADPARAYREIRALLTEAGVEGAGFEADVLIKEAAGRGRFELSALTAAQRDALWQMTQRRAKREPLQYILGHWAFLELEIQVGPGVLIPRAETEQVCLAAAELLAGVPAPAVLELCAGSGAISLGLQSRCPAARITAVELDEAAYEWLCRNISAWAGAHAGARVPAPLRADALTYYKEVGDAALALMVCNPPYVAGAEYAALAPELYAEPKRALVPPGDEGDGLLFYRELAARYRAKLAPGGALVFEIGAAQGAAVREILERAGYAGVEIRPDLAGHDRVAVAWRPG